MFPLSKFDDDILNFLGKHNRYRPKLLVGFSAETENVIERFELLKNIIDLDLLDKFKNKTIQ